MEREREGKREAEREERRREKEKRGEKRNPQIILRGLASSNQQILISHARDQETS